jgi:hypothetical protein
VLCSSGPVVSEFPRGRPRLLPLDCQTRSRASCRLSTLVMNHPHPHSLSIPQPLVGWHPCLPECSQRSPALAPGNSTAFSAVAPSERSHRRNIREWCCDHSPPPRIPDRLTSTRLISSARTAAFHLPDPHCPALWPICYIPPGKLPVCFDDLFMHNRLCGRGRTHPDHIAGRISWSGAGVLPIRGAFVRLPIFGRVCRRSEIERQRRR